MPEFDAFVGKLHTLLSYSPAKAYWRKTVGTTPSEAPFHRWEGRHERNVELAFHWLGLVEWINTFTSADE